VNSASNPLSLIGLPLEAGCDLLDLRREWTCDQRPHGRPRCDLAALSAARMQLVWIVRTIQRHDIAAGKALTASDSRDQAGSPGPGSTGGAPLTAGWGKPASMPSTR